MRRSNLTRMCRVFISILGVCGFVRAPPPGLACTQQRVQWFHAVKTYPDSSRSFRLRADKTEDCPDRITGAAFPLGKVCESFSLSPLGVEHQQRRRLVLLPLPSHRVFTEDAGARLQRQTDAHSHTHIHTRSERRGGRQRALHTLNYAVELITWQSVPIALIGL